MELFYIFSNGDIIEKFEKKDVINCLKIHWKIKEEKIAQIFSSRSAIKSDLSEVEALKIVDAYKKIGLIVLCKRQTLLYESYVAIFKELMNTPPAKAGGVFIKNTGLLLYYWFIFPIKIIEWYSNFFMTIFYASNYWVLQGPILVILLVIFLLLFICIGTYYYFPLSFLL